MDLTSAALLKASTLIFSKVVEDIYAFSKIKIINKLELAKVTNPNKKITKAIASATKIKTLWNIDKEVSIYDFYYPSQLEMSDGVVKKINSLKDLGSSQHFVLQGTAGQGKSILLRYLCGQELRESTTTLRFPIFLELKRVKFSGSLQNLILEALDKFGIENTTEVLDKMFESKKVVLLLDAFDEIEDTQVIPIIDELENLADKYQDSLQIIVTARPDSDIQNSSKFRVLKLKQLDQSDHLPFLKKVCDDKSQYTNLHNVILKSSHDIINLLTTPLMLTLLVMLYKSTQAIPESVPKFYEELFDVLFYKHDNSKTGFRRKRYTNLEDGLIKNLFSSFCFYVRLKSYAVLSTSNFEDCINIAAQSMGINVDPNKFRDEVVKTICLMQQDGLEVAFIHKSVLEYYAASYVKRSNEDFAIKFYSSMLPDKFQIAWAAELNFLSQIDECRHAKFFLLPAINQFENEYHINFTNEFDSKSCDKLINSFHSRVRVRIKINKGEDAAYSVGGFSLYANTTPLLERFRNEFMREIFRLRKDIDLSKIDDIEKKSFPVSRKASEVFLTFGLDEFLSVLTTEQIDKLKKAAYLIIRNIKAQAELIIKLEDEKSNLFDKFFNAS